MNITGVIECGIRSLEPFESVEILPYLTAIFKTHHGEYKNIKHYKPSISDSEDLKNVS